MRKFIILSLLAIIALIIFILALKTCWTINLTAESILIGLLTSTTVVLFIETITFLKNTSRYSYFNRDFKRLEIYNKLSERRNDKIYEDITPRYNEKNVNTSIKVKHCGEGRFVGTAYYEEGKVEFEIFLDQTNPSYGLGSYQYIHKTKGYEMPDFGKLELIRDKVDKEKIYIYYKNIVPSGLAEGYEVWENK
jgi:low affinity Fe/Cu permease